MYYRESTTINRSNCRGYRSNPDMMMFSSHEIGNLKAFFSNYEQYNDSNVSISISANSYSIDITVNTNLSKSDSWCRGKINDALNYVCRLVIESCSSCNDSLPITLELHTY